MNARDLKTLLATAEPSEAIGALQTGRTQSFVDLVKVRKDLNPYDHKIFTDHLHRPDKKIVLDDGSEKTIPVARIAVELQKLIVNRAVAFCFGKDMLLNCEPDDNQKPVLEAVKNVFYDNKIRSFNWKMAESLFCTTETAEVWWLEEDAKTYSNFESNSRLRVSLLDQNKGYQLYPYFDEAGDMIAFSYQFQVDNTNLQGEASTYFETYTTDMHYRWKITDGAWLQEFARKNPINKIPVIYACQQKPEWADVQTLIERLETVLSNFADTNDYHASPILFGIGNFKGFDGRFKGNAGKVIQADEGASLQYVSWNQAPESVQAEIDTLLRMIYTITQTPDISFENVKGIGVTSGVALKLLFSDAHLKVMKKREIFDDYLQRRINIILAFLKQMNNKDKAFGQACDSIMIEPEIVPYMIDDESTTVSTLMSATGQKQIMSQRTAIQALGYVTDIDKEIEDIRAEEDSASYNDLTNPTE